MLLLKRILIASLSLAIVVVCFLIYAFQTESAEQVSRMPKPSQKLPEDIEAVAGQVDMQADPVDPTQRLALAGGEKPRIKRYQGDRLIYEFGAQHWRQDEQGHFDLDRPEIRLHLRGGQIIHIAADGGVVEAEVRSANDYDVKRGQLTGNVHIFLDRMTDEDRLPPEQRQDEISHLWTEMVKFDLELNRVQSDTSIQIEGPELDLAGRGLDIRWNDTTRELERLRIEHGQYLRFKAAGRLFGQQEETADNDRQEDEQAVADAAVDGAADVATTQATQPARRRISTFRIVANQAVRAHQKIDGRTAWSIEADTLELMFDIVGSDGLNTSKKLDEDEDIKNPVELLWSGPLDIMQIDPPLPDTPRRFHVVAMGQPVTLRDGDSTAVCRKMEYHNETERVWLTGTAQETVQITPRPGQHVRCDMLFYDGQTGVLRGDGPGAMINYSRDGAAGDIDMPVLGTAGIAGQGSPSTIQWHDGFELLTVSTGDDADAPTGLAGFAGGASMGQGDGQSGPSRMLERASFRGDVSLSQREQTIRAGRLDVELDTEDTGRSFQQQIRLIHAVKDVVMDNGGDRLECQDIEVHFADDVSGQRRPRHALAIGGVQARQKGRMIMADRVAVSFSEQPLPDDADSVGSNDDELASAGVERLEADGNVRVRDRASDLDLTAHTLVANVGDSNQISTARIRSDSRTPATVVLEEYVIQGHDIDMDTVNELLEVQGAGALRVVTKEDLDGRITSDPIPITIRWRDSMHLYGGQENMGHFAGDVRCSSRDEGSRTLRTTTLSADTANVYFEDIPRVQPVVSADNDQDGPNRFWIFQPLLSPDKQPQFQAIDSGQVDKRLVQLTAATDSDDRQVKMETVTADMLSDVEKSRMTLLGPTIRFDMRARQMNVDGAGQMLIEQYVVDTSQSRGSSGADRRLGTSGTMMLQVDLQPRGPSATAFEWSNGLTYFVNEAKGIFDGSVKMVYASGQQVPAPQDPGMVFSQVDHTEGGSSRIASLQCETLVAQFGGEDTSNASQWNASQLDRVTATGSVYLVDGTRSVRCQRLDFSRSKALVRVEGGVTNPAEIYDIRPDGAFVNRGPFFEWYIDTNEVRAPRTTVVGQ